MTLKPGARVIVDIDNCYGPATIVRGPEPAVGYTVRMDGESTDMCGVDADEMRPLC